MMKLIAKRPCGFGGKRYFVGDEIPVEEVLNPKEQEKMGTLAIVDDDAGAAAPVDPGSGDVTMFPVVIHSKDGDVTISLTAESFQTIMDVLTANAKDAEALVKEIINDDILFLLNAADSRTTIKAAAKARAQALSEAQEDAESAGDQ